MVIVPLFTARIVVPDNCRHPVAPPGAREYEPVARVAPIWIGTVAPSTAWARVRSLKSITPDGGVAMATPVLSTHMATAVATMARLLTRGRLRIGGASEALRETALTLAGSRTLYQETLRKVGLPRGVSPPRTSRR